MEGLEIQQYVTNCLEWIRLQGYAPDLHGWLKLSTGETITSKELYTKYLIEVIKQSI